MEDLFNESISHQDMIMEIIDEELGKFPYETKIIALMKKRGVSREDAAFALQELKMKGKIR